MEISHRRQSPPPVVNTIHINRGGVKNQKANATELGITIMPDAQATDAQAKVTVHKLESGKSGWRWRRGGGKRKSKKKKSKKKKSKKKKSKKKKTKRKR